jgi:hypothetical protein
VDLRLIVFVGTETEKLFWRAEADGEARGAAVNIVVHYADLVSDLLAGRTP